MTMRGVLRVHDRTYTASFDDDPSMSVCKVRFPWPVEPPTNVFGDGLAGVTVLSVHCIDSCATIAPEYGNNTAYVRTGAVLKPFVLPTAAVHTLEQLTAYLTANKLPLTLDSAARVLSFTQANSTLLLPIQDNIWGLKEMFGFTSPLPVEYVNGVACVAIATNSKASRPPNPRGPMQTLTVDCDEAVNTRIPGCQSTCLFTPDTPNNSAYSVHYPVPFQVPLNCSKQVTTLTFTIRDAMQRNCIFLTGVPTITFQLRFL
uniref:LO5 n=1 Tax=Swordtail adomavirus 2 TaxID=2609877 RepID=A0A6F9F202_9VIRU|nr:TPA_asm: LO5 [Swordtail adomavirus 2]